MSNNTQAARGRRHARVRKKVIGSADRPRLAVFRSNKHISAQVIDDGVGRTLAAASSVEKDLRTSITRTGLQCLLRIARRQAEILRDLRIFLLIEQAAQDA